MKELEKEFCTILQVEEESLKEAVPLVAQRTGELKDKNLVVDLQKIDHPGQGEVESFLPISNNHRENGKSFVVVNKGVNISDLPEELVVVPTLLEAEDIIQMDEIQRELGF